MARLIAFAGLSGTGKSSIARGLASEIGAVWLWIDSIEQVYARLSRSADFPKTAP
jgi:predicted kinase